MAWELEERTVAVNGFGEQFGILNNLNRIGIIWNQLGLAWRYFDR